MQTSARIPDQSKSHQCQGVDSRAEYWTLQSRIRDAVQNVNAPEEESEIEFEIRTR